jgi:hypothetical protein
LSIWQRTARTANALYGRYTKAKILKPIEIDLPEIVIFCVVLPSNLSIISSTVRFIEGSQ